MLIAYVLSKTDSLLLRGVCVFFFTEHGVAPIVANQRHSVCPECLAKLAHPHGWKSVLNVQWQRVRRRGWKNIYGTKGTLFANLSSSFP